MKKYLIFYSYRLKPHTYTLPGRHTVEAHSLEEAIEVFKHTDFYTSVEWTGGNRCTLLQVGMADDRQEVTERGSRVQGQIGTSEASKPVSEPPVKPGGAKAKHPDDCVCSECTMPDLHR